MDTKLDINGLIKGAFGKEKDSRNLYGQNFDFFLKQNPIILDKLIFIARFGEYLTSVPEKNQFDFRWVYFPSPSPVCECKTCFNI